MTAYLPFEMLDDLVFETLQCLNPDVWVMLLTGCEESVATQILKMSAWDYLLKPFDLSHLGQIMRVAINATA